ncbi:MAG: shikimate kinase [Candidatus Liberibacter ctenarytainae]|uniref:Shikimate kinase n=1 Tax=Candidatus Liberibacter ctenarytainae TaxID=2020335 RepID=A0A937DL47_9HYPH|nr:shikimate kinase [Candidatus Liberibacter ctenarytainae]
MGQNEKYAHMEIAARARAALGKKNLIFVGAMGAGKTTIGRMISVRMKLPFVDTDCEIEKLSSMTINNFFHYYGEDVFRDIESQVIQVHLQRSSCIIATGGGSFLNEKDRESMRNRGITFYLQAHCNVLWERIRDSGNRPLLNGANPKEILRRLIESRLEIYAQADMTLCCSILSIEETVDHVMRKLIDFRNY